MAEGYLEREDNFSTKALYGEYDPQQEISWPLVPSITLSTAFEQETPECKREFLYGRIKNPTRQVLEKNLAKIENADYVVCFASGLGAITTITSLLSAGDHIVAGRQLYGGTNVLFTQVFPRMNIQATFVDTEDPEIVASALKENTKLVWVESPTNPLLTLTDIAKVSEIVHKQKDVLLVVDNTFQTPYFQRPLELGADISIHSLTKFINGHTDVVMGCAATNNKMVAEKLYFLQHAMGIVPSPFDCYQVFRSLKTFPLRMERHMKSSIEIARYLETKQQVERVIHPGLSSHPQHALQKKQCYGTSGMVSFYIKGGIKETKLFIKSLKMIKYAGSLGGYTTNVVMPFFVSHVSLSLEEKTRRGITDNLIRMTVGLESVNDIIHDIEQALQCL